MRRLALPASLLAFILADDAILRSRGWPIVVQGLLDEPAHAATALLFLLAIPLVPHRLWPTALGASVLVDLDHLLIYSGVGTFGAHGRPPGHTLIAIAVVSVVPRYGYAAAVGISLHVLRDAFTGPGVPILWPVHSTAYLGPYYAYVIVLAVAVIVRTGTARQAFRRTRAR